MFSRVPRTCLVFLAGAALLPQAQAAEPPSIAFTPAEQAYIARAQPVTMCVDPDWEPFERINETGSHEGIAADLVQLVAERTGLRIMLHPTGNWDESLDASRAGRCQILSFLNRTPEREGWLAFTGPIFFDPNVIITREEHGFIANLHGISNETVALPRGTMVEEKLRSLYPNLTVVLTGSEQESVSLVSDRKADMTVRSLIVAAYAIRKEGLFNLKISGQVPELTNELRIGVLKDEPILRDILDKGVATLTPQERDSISNRHVSVQVQSGIDYVLTWKIVGGAAVLLLIAVYWNRKLSRMNRELYRLNRELRRLSMTDPLTGLFNRMKIDDTLDSELQRARRYGQGFGLIMVDIDHFKQVNDAHGHQAGDTVLTELAGILQGQIRATDTAGRWGGEEFIVVCPQTDEAGTAKLGEELRQRIEAHVFPVIGQVTASFGVAAWRAEDRVEDLVGRADAALYESKRQGRNRLRIAA